MDEFYTIFEIDKCVKSVYSTVTDLIIPTKVSKFIPYLKFVCVIIYCKGSIVSTKYKDFDIVFVEKCQLPIIN